MPARTRKRLTHDEGFALIAALSIMAAAAAAVGSYVLFAITTSQAQRRTRDDTSSFYLAEGGLAEAKYELAEATDPAGDGTGNTSWAGAAGSFNVAVTDLGGGVYQLDSTGNAGATSTMLQEIVVREVQPGLPTGAIAFVNQLEDNQLLFSSSTNLILDGGDNAAISFTDDTAYQDISQQFVEDGIDEGYVQTSGVTGAIYNPIGGVNLSTNVVAGGDDGIPSNIYDTLYATATSLQSSATTATIGTTTNKTYGSASSPVTVKFAANAKITSGKTRTGYGTAVFAEKFTVEGGGTFNWTGDVIIRGTSSVDASLEINGTVNVTGNIIVVGGDGKGVKFDAKSDSDVNVTGTLAAVTDYYDTGTKLEFNVENDFNLSGLLINFASILQTEFKPGCDALVNGAMLIGRPLSPAEASIAGTKLQLKFDQDLEIHKDGDNIALGIEELDGLGVEMGTASGGSDDLSQPAGLTSQAWSRFSSNGGTN